MRGANNFNTLLFAEETPVVALEPVRSIGRDARYIAARDRRLLHRYYWHATREIEPKVRMSYPSLMETLETEFDLSPTRISRIVDANHAAVRTIREENRGLRFTEISKKFAKEWPFMAW